MDLSDEDKKKLDSIKERVANMKKCVTCSHEWQSPHPNPECPECGAAYAQIGGELWTLDLSQHSHLSGYSGGKEKQESCPKCGYVRQSTDIAPDYECPKCGIVYKKYLAHVARDKQDRFTDERLSTVHIGHGVVQKEISKVLPIILAQDEHLLLVIRGLIEHSSDWTKGYLLVTEKAVFLWSDGKTIKRISWREILDISVIDIKISNTILIAEGNIEHKFSTDFKADVEKAIALMLNHKKRPIVTEKVGATGSNSSSREEQSSQGPKSEPPSAEDGRYEERKRCPFCAEEILALAMKCKHCGSDLAEVTEPQEHSRDASRSPGREQQDSEQVAHERVVERNLQSWEAKEKELKKASSTKYLIAFGFVVLLVILAGYVKVWKSSTEKYFFMINDYDQTPCVQTKFSTKQEIKKRLEDSSGMECTGMEDNSGQIIMTCKGILTNMYVFADTKATCESMHKSFKTMLEN